MDVLFGKLDQCKNVIKLKKIQMCFSDCFISNHNMPSLLSLLKYFCDAVQEDVAEATEILAEIEGHYGLSLGSRQFTGLLEDASDKIRLIMLPALEEQDDDDRSVRGFVYKFVFANNPVMVGAFVGFWKPNDKEEIEVLLVYAVKILGNIDMLLLLFDMYAKSGLTEALDVTSARDEAINAGCIDMTQVIEKYEKQNGSASSLVSLPIPSLPTGSASGARELSKVSEHWNVVSMLGECVNFVTSMLRTAPLPVSHT